MLGKCKLSIQSIVKCICSHVVVSNWAGIREFLALTTDKACWHEILQIYTTVISSKILVQQPPETAAWDYSSMKGMRHAMVEKERNYYPHI